MRVFQKTTRHVSVWHLLQLHSRHGYNSCDRPVNFGGPPCPCAPQTIILCEQAGPGCPAPTLAPTQASTTRTSWDLVNSGPTLHVAVRQRWYFTDAEMLRVKLSGRCASGQVIVSPRSALVLFQRIALATTCWPRPASSSDSVDCHCAQIIVSHQYRVGRLPSRVRNLGRLPGTKVALKSARFV